MLDDGSGTTNDQQSGILTKFFVKQIFNSLNFENFSGSDEDEENGEISGLIDDTDGISQSDFTTTRKQQSSGNLDAKIIKALKKQEEKRDKRALRKKEVSFLIVLTKNSTFVTKITNLNQCEKSCMTPVWTTWKW